MTTQKSEWRKMLEFISSGMTVIGRSEDVKKQYDFATAQPQNSIVSGYTGQLFIYYVSSSGISWK